MPDRVDIVEDPELLLDESRTSGVQLVGFATWHNSHAAVKAAETVVGRVQFVVVQVRTVTLCSKCDSFGCAPGDGATERCIPVKDILPSTT